MLKIGAFVLVLLAGSASAAEFDCKRIEKSFQRDLSALTKYFEGGDNLTHVKAKKPLEMVKQYVAKHFGDSEYEFVENSNSIGDESSVAGTTSEKEVRSAIDNFAETWFLSSESSGDLRKKRQAIKAALDKVFTHKVYFGFVDGLQGWGGSPASEVLFMYPSCGAVFSLFLGITHD